MLQQQVVVVVAVVAVGKFKASIAFKLDVVTSGMMCFVSKRPLCIVGKFVVCD
jgi:hypothetical protein